MRFDKTSGATACVLALILCGFALGVLALTPEAMRGDLLTKAAGPIGGLVAAISAAIAAVSARNGHKETAAQTGTINEIARQTNGALTGGIREAVEQALDARGVLVPETVPVAVVATPDGGVLPLVGPRQ